MINNTSSMSTLLTPEIPQMTSISTTRLERQRQSLLSSPRSWALVCSMAYVFWQVSHFLLRLLLSSLFGQRHSEVPECKMMPESICLHEFSLLVVCSLWLNVGDACIELAHLHRRNERS